MFGAFGGRFDEHDWDHTLGGVHVLAEDGGVVAHGAVVPRTLVAGGGRCGPGTSRGWRPGGPAGAGAGHAGDGEVGGSSGGYELGALGDGSGIPGFYQRLGWETWQGPTWVAGPDGPERTAEEDGSILVLRTPATGELDLTGPITCDWRAGDVW